MSQFNQTDVIADICNKLNRAEITLGQAIYAIRTRLYQLTQADYARLCKVSEKTLREVEKGNTDPRLSIIERLLRPGGLALTTRVLTNRV
ncbi:helix-turn-helix domain-containing protein [Rheinheimera fenheensis]|uniref:helix-turn-helix domain-containing protein n=1 Tax=Rheinheimera fenheensis TaxID=3152295 RepID=UPI003261C6B3